MGYAVPGRADQLEAADLAAWNAVIDRSRALVLREQGQQLGQSHFFVADHGDLSGAKVTDVAHWPANPLEPEVCLDLDTVQQLCDWGARGRHELQNEYCEYATIRRPDGSGRSRPKRVEITTELAEYWTEIAARNPPRITSRSRP